jgi:hypothetical protein
VNAQFTVVTPPRGGGNHCEGEFPGAAVVVLESVSPADFGEDVETLACESFYPFGDGHVAPVSASASVNVVLIPPAGKSLSPGTFDVVECADAGPGVALVMLGGPTAAVSGTVTLTSIPTTDAGSYVGSFSVTVSGQELSGQFSAPFCAAIL